MHTCDGSSSSKLPCARHQAGITLDSTICCQVGAIPGIGARAVLQHSGMWSAKSLVGCISKQSYNYNPVPPTRKSLW